MKITYKIDDGAIRDFRSFNLEINDNHLSRCRTANEREDLITEIVQAHFEQHISWHITKREG